MYIIGLMFWCYITHHTSHMIPTKHPRSFNKLVFPSGISSCKYAPGISNVATSFYSYAPIIDVVNSASSVPVGDAIISPFIKYRLCLLPYSYVITFMVPSLFLFIRFTASVAFSLSKLYSTFGLISEMTLFTGMVPSSDCFNSFTITGAALSSNILKPLDA